MPYTFVDGGSAVCLPLAHGIRNDLAYLSQTLSTVKKGMTYVACTCLLPQMPPIGRAIFDKSLVCNYGIRLMRTIDKLS